MHAHTVLLLWHIRPLPVMSWLRVAQRARTLPSRRLLAAWSTSVLLPKAHQLLAARPRVSQSFGMAPPASQTQDNRAELLSSYEYEKVADITMHNLVDRLEAIVEAEFSSPSWEVDYHSGVLTLHLGDSGTYVINKQPPNQQIWLSSPLSGPKRYDYDKKTGHWVYGRDASSLRSLLVTELADITKLSPADTSRELGEGGTFE